MNKKLNKLLLNNWKLFSKVGWQENGLGTTMESHDTHSLSKGKISGNSKRCGVQISTMSATVIYIFLGICTPGCGGDYNHKITVKECDSISP